MKTQEYTSKTLDHLGLVAGMCQEIGISQLIDRHCPSVSPDQIVSTGKALEAMILNGLGFVNKRLYLIPRFFEDKPVERLLGPGYEASHFNDDRLGRALDQLYATGVTTLFAHLSRRVFEVLDYRPTRGHLDTTSLSVHGKYNSETESSEVSGLHITQGYSKDKRPDLPQVSLQLICEHLSGIPIHMEALNGNSSDSESFRSVILNFGKQLRSEDGLVTIVADSKMYSQETLQALQDSRLNWICRVPGTLDAVKTVLEQIKPGNLNDLKELGAEGYRSACYTFTYADVEQHWVVYYSESAAEREAKTLQRKLDKESEQARKSLKNLQRQVFHCREDALQAAGQCGEKWSWHELKDVRLKESKKHDKPGRPGAGEAPVIQYTVEAQLQVKQAQWDQEVFKRSLFVLATNQSIDTLEQHQELLHTYKEQHSVERGFRFIKDPNIVASSFYVQKPERVAALLFVMTSCLLVYAALEYRIRQSLEKENETVPDQKGKPTKTPTARWVFQLFVGIHALTLPDGKKIILNLKEDHRKILSLLSYWHFYT
jgi:transposase